MVLNNHPIIVVGYNCISPSFCDTIIENSSGRFEQSKSFFQDDDKDVVDRWRTSSTYIDYKDQCIDLRKFSVDVVNRLMNNPITLRHVEFAQIQKYEQNQYYKPHCDYYNYGSNVTDNDRIATLIFYLNQTFEGGCTYFNRLNIRVKPTKGSCLFFAYDYDDYTNQQTEHCGEPVDGVKYIATCWIRKFPYLKN